MQNDTLKKINDLLKLFNNTFEIQANFIQEKDEIIATNLTIPSIKNDGSLFVDGFHETFNSIVKSISSEHEVIFDEAKGLVIARKVVKTQYVIDEV